MTMTKKEAYELAIKALKERPTTNGMFMASPTEVVKPGEPLSNPDEISKALEKGDIYRRGFEDGYLKGKEDRPQPYEGGEEE